MRVNLLVFESEKNFEEFCQALLKEELSHFQAFSAPDLGMDGYDQDSETIFQAYFPERAPRQDKIRNDLEKAKANSCPCKRWVLLLPKNATPPLLRWIYRDQQPLFPFTLEVWGRTEILALLRKHPKVREAYFPTELRVELQRLAKGKRPGARDAGPGEEVSPDQAAELKTIILRLAEQEAARKRRKPRSSDFGREYGEFKSHFMLSSYDRLPSAVYLEARRYLESKLYARRGGETRAQERNRLVAGIHAIQKKLQMSDVRYRQTLVETAGRASSREMDIDEPKRVFQRFKYFQGLAEAEDGK